MDCNQSEFNNDRGNVFLLVDLVFHIIQGVPYACRIIKYSVRD